MDKRKSAYRMSRGTFGTVGLPIPYGTLSDITWALIGNRGGDVQCINRVGGGRHHIVNGVAPILVLLPGDTNYPREREAENG